MGRKGKAYSPPVFSVYSVPTRFPFGPMREKHSSCKFDMLALDFLRHVYGKLLVDRSVPFKVQDEVKTTHLVLPTR